MICSHPRESVGIVMASAAVLIIFVNALFLQKGPHPAPIFAKPAITSHVVPPFASSPIAAPPMSPPASLLNPVPTPTAPPRARPAERPRAMLTEPAQPRRNDPIAELLSPSPRVASVQRALSDFGYGQIKANGEFGPETREAIEKFERAHKMPVSGKISDGLLKALGTMTGRPLE
jgi:hypothetical protein